MDTTFSPASIPLGAGITVNDFSSFSPASGERPALVERSDSQVRQIYQWVWGGWWVSSLQSAARLGRIATDAARPRAVSPA